MMLSETIERKFTEVLDASDWLIETDTGWEELIDIKETIEYEIYTLTLKNGDQLLCADDHIVFGEGFEEVFAKNLASGDLIYTKYGLSEIESVVPTGQYEKMYDVGVNSTNHRFYSNGILSHNTTCAAAYLLWNAMFKSDQTILIAAHKYTGAQEIMQRIRYGYEMCPDHIRCGVVNYNKGSMEFDNGSRIVSATTTSNTGRGMAISLLYLDEFAYVQPNIAEEFWTSISPTLATGGRAIITSTPNSDEDKFAIIWKESQNTFDEYGIENPRGIGINGFYGFTAKWDEHPDRDEAWKQREKAKIGEEKWRREFQCEFLIDTETLVNSIKLAELVGTPPIEVVNQIRWYKKPSKNQMYLVALDPSLGTGGNNAAIEVFEVPSFTQVAEWQHNITPIQGQIKLLRELLIYLDREVGNMNQIYWSVENNTVGEAGLIAIRELGEETFPGWFLSEPIRKGHVRKYRKGFNTTYGSKISACSKLKYLIEEDKMTINSRPLISELKGYTASGVTFKAKSGMTDDLVSALLLIVRMGALLSEWDARVSDSMSSNDELQHDEDLPMPVFYSIF